MRDAYDHDDGRRVIEIDLDVVPADENEIDQPEGESEQESADEDYDPRGEAEDDDESIQSLINPAADDGYVSLDDEDEEDY